MELTKDADALLCIIYNDYLSRVDSEGQKKASQGFGSREIHDRIIPSVHIDTIDYFMGELKQKGLIDCFSADNLIAYYGSLSYDGILYMQNKYDSKSKVLKHLRDLVLLGVEIAVIFLKG